MKTLLLLRHAKSSWKDPAMPDKSRPLNRRGRNAAVAMGRLVEREALWPELILCSTAVRTRQTCELLLRSAERPVPTQFQDELYECSPEGISRILQEVADDRQRVMIIGHNPELQEFLAAAAGYADKFPTAGLAVLTAEIGQWSELRPRQTMVLQRVWRPRELE